MTGSYKQEMTPIPNVYLSPSALLWSAPIPMSRLCLLAQRRHETHPASAIAAAPRTAQTHSEWLRQWLL